MTKTALVTGGTRGIGLGISRCLAKAGYRLALCGRKSQADVEASLEELRGLGTEVVYCQGDISRHENRENIIQKIKQEFGSLNVLVNNAGIAPAERADILEAGEESFDKLIGVNLKSPYLLTQLVANWMVEQKHDNPAYSGSIVFITSVSAVVASVNRGDYCISKAGLAMAAKLWAVRLAEFDIPVYEVRPGIIATDMTSGVKEKYDKMIEEGLLLLPRWGTPEDIGKTVAMLCNGDMLYATGEVITLDGGMTVPRL